MDSLVTQSERIARNAERKSLAAMSAADLADHFAIEELEQDIAQRDTVTRLQVWVSLEAVR